MSMRTEEMFQLTSFADGTMMISEAGKPPSSGKSGKAPAPVVVADTFADGTCQMHQFILQCKVLAVKQLLNI
jgi:hypothetical protein